MSDEAIPAATLILVRERASGPPELLMVERSGGMAFAAGALVFPGGRVDAGEDVVTAALREAQEEILLDPREVDVIGEADRYRTVTGYVVTPVLAVVPPDLPLEPHEREVADWFEAQLDFILDPANQVRRSALLRGRERHYYEILWQDRRIWGATAAMIVNLSRRLQWP